MNIEVEGDKISFYDNDNIGIESKWLHGAVADGLKAKVGTSVKPCQSKFQWL